ncbi:MAG: family 16 glycosylhydrolase [Ruminiclostridium sp.]|nr:family 16 glycosylhydrolase [Ruminiclostridium sp.]
MKKRSLLKVITSAAVSLSLLVTSAVTSSAASKFNGSYFGSGFDYYETDKFEKSNGWSNGGMFDCTWSGNNVSFSGGIMNLSITGNRWSGFNAAEYRTNQTFGFGMYDVSMKPVRNDGVVSSFFTYTGPSDGTVWDEIDIEFLGKNTNQVQFNYYTRGQGNHEYVYNLGFDASQSFHQYGFYWDSGSITWYVDKKPVYTATRDIPQTPGRIMMNLWNGTGVDEWLKAYNGVAPLTAQYDWISYTAPSSGSQQTNNNNNNNNSWNNNNQQQNNNNNNWNNNNNNNNSGSFQSGKKYVIKSLNSGKALDVSWGSKDSGANVLQYSYCGYENQKWLIESLGNGYYSIKSANSGKSLDVSGASTSDGANVQQWDYHGGSCQQWKIEATNGGYSIINRNSGKALDVSGKSKADNANVLQWRYTGANNQIWVITEA